MMKSNSNCIFVDLYHNGPSNSNPTLAQEEDDDEPDIEVKAPKRISNKNPNKQQVVAVEENSVAQDSVVGNIHVVPIVSPSQIMMTPNHEVDIKVWKDKNIIFNTY